MRSPPCGSTPACATHPGIPASLAAARAWLRCPAVYLLRENTDVSDAPESLPGPSRKGFDELDRSRGKQDEGMKAVETPGAGDGTSKVTRLPRRPRRVAEEAGERFHKTRRSDGGSVYDPAPTKPVLRSELQRETGWWPVDPGAARHPAPKDDPGSAEPDASVIDLDALRRKRAGEDAPAAGIRRMVKPRRVGKSASERAGTEGQPDSGRNGDPDQVDGPAGPR